MADLLPLPAGYHAFLADLKQRIRSAQTRTALAVSWELVLLYWSIGRDILLRQNAEGWGPKVIERLSHDLQTEFPGVEGYSPRNLNICGAWPTLGRTQR